MSQEPNIAANLPPLERQVFLAVRSGGRVTVSAVADRLPSTVPPLAYTTVMTMLTRLCNKGYLLRHQEGRAYVYEAPSEQDIGRELGGRAARQALEKFGAPALPGFVNSLSPEQRALVARLLEEGGGEDEKSQMPR